METETDCQSHDPMNILCGCQSAYVIKNRGEARAAVSCPQKNEGRPLFVVASSITPRLSGDWSPMEAAPRAAAAGHMQKNNSTDMRRPSPLCICLHGQGETKKQATRLIIPVQVHRRLKTRAVQTPNFPKQTRVENRERSKKKHPSYQKKTFQLWVREPNTTE